MSHLSTTDSELGSRIEEIDFGFLRWGLVISVGWIAAMKATEYEAIGIQPLIAHSPLMSWMYKVWSVRHATEIIGSMEGLFVLLIALRRWSPRACAIGSAGTVLMFLTTLSFLFSTPRWEPTLGGFPALSEAWASSSSKILSCSARPYGRWENHFSR